AKLTQPTLCVVGDQDGATPPALVESMAALITGSRFVVIKDAGHLPSIEQPAQLAAAMLKFLQRHTLQSNRFEQGMQVRRSVLGNAHVDRATANKTEFDEPF